MLYEHLAGWQNGAFMITISVCLIVRNEEAVLARCLDSLKIIADEIIVVDTGSTDNTKKVAKQYTEKVFDFTWIDDFAAARNFSFSKASKDYIYSADADEIIDEPNRERFLSLKQFLLPEIEIVQMYYTNQLQHNTTYNYDKELRPKLYKRLREFVWIDPLHESVRQEPVIYNSEVEIIHMPAENHAKRDFMTFQRAISQQGNLSVKLRGMYARELFVAGEDADFLDAEEFFLFLSEQSGCSEEELKTAHCILARAARLRKDTDAFFKSVLKLFALGEPPSEICHELGLYYMVKEDLEEAILWFYNAAYETKPDLNLKYQGEFPLTMIAECYRKLGREEDAKAYEDIIS